MRDKDLILGIDTSNYTTSIAAVDSGGNICCDLRRLLQTKKGERGLRQSAAFFQHIENLPQLYAQMTEDIDVYRIAVAAVSSRPRPAEGSYMPVFRAGQSFGKVIADTLAVPYHEFSHQEGHIAAAKEGSALSNEDGFICFHLSGGTCEVLEVTGRSIEIIGGSKDISYGQLIDRAGVAMGMDFPAGAKMDKLACQSGSESSVLKEIPVDGIYVNLSGIETQALRMLEGGANSEELIKELFHRITDSLHTLIFRSREKSGLDKVLLVGGVSSSEYIKRHLTGDDIVISPAEMATDNAVGTALLGREKTWR